MATFETFSSAEELLAVVAEWNFLCACSISHQTNHSPHVPKRCSQKKNDFTDLLFHFTHQNNDLSHEENDFSDVNFRFAHEKFEISDELFRLADETNEISHLRFRFAHLQNGFADVLFRFASTWKWPARQGVTMEMPDSEAIQTNLCERCLPERPLDDLNHCMSTGTVGI